MKVSPFTYLFGFSYLCTVFLTLTNALSSDISTASISTLPLPILRKPKSLPDHSLHKLQNATSFPSFGTSRCYKPAHTAQYVSPQDATIALGEVARFPNFFIVRTFNKSIAMAIEGTAVILLVKVGNEDDQFTIYDIVMQALNIINYCIFQQFPGERLGGDIEVASLGLASAGFFTANGKGPEPSPKEGYTFPFVTQEELFHKLSWFDENKEDKKDISVFECPAMKNSDMGRTP
ncbi:MAG: hypothetical protein Q9169_005518 [Polycauliona sp. 2 TL-2023]